MKAPFYLKFACILICIVLIPIILIFGKEFLLPIAIACLITFMLYPLCKRLENWKVPRIIAVILSILAVTMVLVTGIYLISSQLASLVSELTEMKPQMITKLNILHHTLKSNLHITNATLNMWIDNAKNNLLDYSGTMLSGTLATTKSILACVLLVPVYIFCFLLYKKSFKDFAYSLVNSQHHNEISILLQNIQKLSQSYLLGLFTVILIIGTLNTIGLYIVGIQYAIFFGFFAALLTIIPYIGIFMGSILPIIFALLTKDTIWGAIGVVIVFSIVQFLESNYFTPKVVGSRVSINPFAAIVALLIGGELWGAAGMILSIPITAICKLIFDTLPSTKPIGYFIGSELTDDNGNPFKIFQKNKKKPI
jgi:predicted PurR-regulated permease PerM